MTTDQILSSVADETLFGMVECDLRVPETWDEVMYRPTTSLNPYDYFEEMSPIFCTSEIPVERTGRFMQDYIKENDLSTKPRKLMIGGMRAENVLLLTPLLRWYILHGILVSKVHQVIEFSRLKCFEEFGREVTERRRAGDQNQDLQVFATLSKLEGNAAFGGTIMNKEKFKRTTYVEGFRNSCVAVNNPLFQSMSELSNEYYEVEYD